MGWLDRLREAFKREADDAKQWMDEAVADANVDLDRAERRIDPDPSVRMDATLDDIADSEHDLEAVRARAEGRTVRPAAEAELEDREGPRMPEPEGGGSSAPEEPLPGMAMARLWVTAEGSSSLGEGWHELRVHESVGPVVGEEWFAEEFPGVVAEREGVEEVRHEDREVLHVRAPGLSTPDVRLLVATVLAPRIGEDWQERLR